MSLKLGNSLCKHQSVIKVTQWNLKVISLRIPLQNNPNPNLVQFKSPNVALIMKGTKTGQKWWGWVTSSNV